MPGTTENRGGDNPLAGGPQGPVREVGISSGTDIKLSSSGEPLGNHEPFLRLTYAQHNPAAVRN